jgi:tetratricopeptide (TPR) repeat protein
MNEEKLRVLFEEATELAPEARAQFVDTACNGDSGLKHELEALLAADEAAHEEEFLRHSAIRNEAFADYATGSALGATIGNYRLVELIGRGGMGAVYRAVRIDAEFEMSAAVKLIDGAFTSPELIAHFRAERQILANLEHPNIARLLDGGARADGLPYLIMEYVEGISPYDFARNHNLSTAERLALFRQICSAVHYAHQHMVIHRDLKPANILVTADGIPKLLDFGIAKVLTPEPSRWRDALTEPGTLKLTLRYASPEQVRGEPVTTASDVYSLGVILYELLTGHSPYGDADLPTHEIMRIVCEEEPPRPSSYAPKLKGDLDNIILRALRKAPLERYASADQFSEDIRRTLEGRPVLARGDAPLYVAAKFIRRNRVLVVAAALLLVSLVGGLVEVTLARARADRRFNDVRRLAHSVMFDYADAIDRLPGATPVRARLVQDALTYLDNLSKEADTPQLQREIVDAYVRVSNVQGNEYENNLGDTQAAMISAYKAVNAAEKLLREDRTAPALASAASAFSTYGSLLYSTGDLKKADGAYQHALDLYQQLATSSPNDLDNKIALSICLRHLGDLYGGYGFQNLGKTPEALAYYQRAKMLTGELAIQFPGNVDVAKESYKTLISLSSEEAAVGEHPAAVKDLSDALTQIHKVSAADPGDTNPRTELAVAESRLGQMLLDDRNTSAAILHFSQAAGLLNALLKPDPTNATYRRGESVVEAQWAQALRIANQLPEAISHNERALQLAESLSKDAPGSVQYRADVGANERKLAESLTAAGNGPAALHHAQQAVQILCRSDPPPTDPNSLANCGRALVVAGTAYAFSHNSAAALSSFREAETIASARSQADPRNAIFRSDWARSQAALAAELAETGDFSSARTMYEAALASWSILRSTKAISAEDAHRSDAAAQALAALRSQH